MHNASHIICYSSALFTLLLSGYLSRKKTNTHTINNQSHILYGTLIASCILASRTVADKTTENSGQPAALSTLCLILAKCYALPTAQENSENLLLNNVFCILSYHAGILFFLINTMQNTLHHAEKNETLATFLAGGLATTSLAIQSL